MTVKNTNTPEVWKTIEGFENYQVSRSGEIKRAVTSPYHPKQRILRVALDGDGYGLVTLYKNGKAKTVKVHHAVTNAFLGKRPDGLQVNHIDGVKLNNCLENLEYVTCQENLTHAAKNGLTAKGDKNAMRKYPLRGFNIGKFIQEHPELSQGERNPNAKLTAENIKEIRKLSDQGIKTGALVKKFNVSRKSIQDIKFHRTWKNTV